MTKYQVRVISPLSSLGVLGVLKPWGHTLREGGSLKFTHFYNFAEITPWDSNTAATRKIKASL